MTPPTVHTKNRNVAASSIRDLKLKGIRPPNARPAGPSSCTVRLTESVRRARRHTLLCVRAQDLYVGIERVKRPPGYHDRMKWRRLALADRGRNAECR